VEVVAGLTLRPRVGGRNLSCLAGTARLASAGGDGVVTIWNLDTGQPLLELQHGARIHAVAMNHDGSLVATAGRDGRVGVWEVVTGDHLRWLEHPRAVHDVTFDREGACLLTAGGDGRARVWNVRTGDIELVVRHRRTLWGRTVLASGDALRSWVVPADREQLVRMAVRVPRRRRVCAATGSVVGVVVAAGAVGLAAFTAWVLFADVLGPWIVDDVVRDEGGTILEAGVLDVGRADEVRVGDCLVEDVPWLTRWLVPWMEVWYGEPIVGVPCQEPHDLEVFAVAALPDALGNDALDQAAIDAEAWLLCDARLAEDLGRGSASSALAIMTWAPTPDAWRDGHREVACWVTRYDGAKLQGSVRDHTG
jgi:hypothetical protein